LVQSVLLVTALYAQTTKDTELGIAFVGLPLQVFCAPMLSQNDLLTVTYVPVFTDELTPANNPCWTAPDNDCVVVAADA
jgi:hypothetical protein